MESVIHLKTKETFKAKQNKLESEEVVNKFLESFILLDVSVFEPYMSEEDIFENMGKYEFLHQIQSTFEDLRSKTNEDFWVTNVTTTCGACSWGKRVEHFKIYNNKTKKLMNEIGYLIDVRGGILFDIYLCNFFEK